MKKVCGWAAFLICSVVLIYFYSYIDYAQPIYEESFQAENMILSEKITSQGEISQSFKVTQSTLSAVKVKFKVYDSEMIGDLEYELVDKNTNEVIREGLINSKKVKDGKYTQIDFDKIEDSNNKEYIFKIKGSVETEISLYLVPETNKNTKLYINSHEVESIIALDTIENAFSFETFIIVICFEIYILLFIKLLYRLFK